MSVRPPEPLRLICLELQRDSMAGFPRLGARAALFCNCRIILAYARGAGWPVAHIYRRSGSGRGLPAGEQPIAGFQPLPSEPVFFREAQSIFGERCPWPPAHQAPGARSIVIGFVNDRPEAESLAGLSLVEGGATLVADALGGAFAHAAIERAASLVRVCGLVGGDALRERAVDWPRPANAP